MAAVRTGLTERAARHFGCRVGAGVALSMGALAPWMSGGVSWPRWPWWVGGTLAAWGLVHPRSLAPVHARWDSLARVLGRAQTWVALGAVYFLLVTPLGLLRRALGRDGLQLRRDPEASTYRVLKARRSASSLENPY